MTMIQHVYRYTAEAQAAYLLYILANARKYFGRIKRILLLELINLYVNI